MITSISIPAFTSGLVLGELVDFVTTHSNKVLTPLSAESKSIRKRVVLISLNEEILKKIAATAMTGKGAESGKERLASLVVEAISQVAEGNDVDFNDIKLQKKVGGGISDAELIQGIVLDKEKVHSAMPKLIKNPKIALLDAALEIKNPETDTKIQISDPKQLEGWVKRKLGVPKSEVPKVARAIANKIKNRGTKPQPFIDSAIAQTSAMYKGQVDIIRE